MCVVCTGSWCWQRPVVSWTTRKRGGNTSVAKSWDSFSDGMQQQQLALLLGLQCDNWTVYWLHWSTGCRRCHVIAVAFLCVCDKYTTFLLQNCTFLDYCSLHNCRNSGKWMIFTPTYAMDLCVFSTLSLLLGRQEKRTACKNWVMRCWYG